MHLLQDVTSHYNLGKVLGRGQFGTTRVAECKSSGNVYACKSIAKRKLTCVACACACANSRAWKVVRWRRQLSPPPRCRRRAAAAG